MMFCTRYKIDARLILLLSLTLVFLPNYAFASSGLCNAMTNPSSGIAAGIVACVKQQFSSGVSSLIGALTTFMMSSGVFQGMVTLAILFFGIQLFGRGAGWAEALGFLVRLGVVGMYWSAMGRFASDFMEMPEDLVRATSMGDPWQMIDEFMQKLLGYGTALTIGSGIIGILAGAMFSSAFGFAVFFFGIKALLDVFFMVVQAIFVYLTSFMVIAFMFAISPIIVPLALFHRTEEYVQAWFSVVVAAILTPMFVVICLTTFLPLIPPVVDNIFKELNMNGTNKESIATFARSQNPLFSVLMPSDPNKALSMGNGSSLQDPTVTGFSNPAMSAASNAAMFDVSSINMGPNTVGILKKLLIYFAQLIVITYMLRSLLDQMPVIASGIAGGGSNIFNMSATQIEAFVKGQVKKLEQNLTGKR